MSNHKLYEKIFLSHSSKDKDVVYKFIKHLKKSDVQLWFDEFDIILGENILEKITEGIYDTQILLLFVSKNSINSGWVKYEWTSYISKKLSENKNVYLIPIIIDDVEIPSTFKNFKYVKTDNDNIEPAIKSVVTAIQLLIKKIADEKRGYETIQLIDREKIVDEEITIVERHITIKTLSNKSIAMDFHQWQTHSGESSIIRTSVVDNSTQEIIHSTLEIVEQTDKNFHLSNKFKPESKNQVITIFFEIICKNYHADIFKIGYSQIDFLLRYPIKKYTFIMEVPLKKEFENIEVHAMYNQEKIEVEKKDLIMDRVFKYSLPDLFPMEEITTVTKNNT